MYDEILFPTDGSDGANAAQEHAIEQALAHDATLHVLYVIEDMFPTVEANAPDMLAELEREGERSLETARAQANAADVESIRGTVASGSPYRQILAYVDERDIDMIVMGTHGRRGIDRYLLGSVAEKIVRSADCPVVTVRSEE